MKIFIRAIFTRKIFVVDMIIELFLFLQFEIIFLNEFSSEVCSRSLSDKDFYLSNLLFQEIAFAV